MLLASRTRIRKALLPPLLALCAACLWPAAGARAESVTVSLVVYVVEAGGAPAEFPAPVNGAQVSVGRAGEELFSGTVKGDRLYSRKLQFDPDTSPSYELKVTAEGFEARTLRIPPDRLRETDGGTLPLVVLLTKTGATPVADTNNQPVTGNGNDNRAGGGNVNLNANVAPRVRTTEEGVGLFASMWNAVVWAWQVGVWWLGVVLVSLVVAVILVWRRYGLRPSFVRPGSQPPVTPNDTGVEETAGEQGDMLSHFLRLNKSLSEMARLQGETYRLVESLPSIINRDPSPVPAAVNPDVPAARARGQQAARGAPNASSDGPLMMARAAEVAPQAGAMSSYQRLLGGRGGGAEPVYLNAENKGSFSDRFEDNNVYLCEVGHTQGTFVLFPEGEKSGWVFPNPGLVFREQALRPVFPSLTEGEFNDRKESITPRPASRVDEGRWKLEGS